MDARLISDIVGFIIIGGWQVLTCVVLIKILSEFSEGESSTYTKLGEILKGIATPVEAKEDDAEGKDNLKKAIQDFCNREYDSVPEFENGETGILFSTVDLDEDGASYVDMQINADIDNLTVTVEANGQYIDSDEFDNEEEMAKSFEQSDFDSMYSWGADKVRLKLGVEW